MNIRQCVFLLKKYQLIVVAVLIFVFITSIFLLNETKIAANLNEHPLQEKESFEVMGPKTVEVILMRKYLDGEISEEIKQETIWSMEDFWAFYADWNLIDQNDQQIIFKQDVDDISPLLKINGYFGISEDGTLRIYNGKPNEEKIIQSFFQINTKRLKSHEQIELKEGIPVLSREHYQEVLSLLKKYKL